MTYKNTIKTSLRARLANRKLADDIARVWKKCSRNIEEGCIASAFQCIFGHIANECQMLVFRWNCRENSNLLAVFQGSQANRAFAFIAFVVLSCLKIIDDEIDPEAKCVKWSID